jgi:hypothetical protein
VDGHLGEGKWSEQALFLHRDFVLVWLPWLALLDESTSAVDGHLGEGKGSEQALFLHRDFVSVWMPWLAFLVESSSAA